jgi:prevent-host-death family protein
MRKVSVADAKAQLPSLLQAAEAGEQVVITRHGRPVAEVRAIAHAGADRPPDRGLAWLAERRGHYPAARQDSLALIRAMRDADDH